MVLLSHVGLANQAADPDIALKIGGLVTCDSRCAGPQNLSFPSESEFVNVFGRSARRASGARSFHKERQLPKIGDHLTVIDLVGDLCVSSSVIEQVFCTV